MRRFEIWDHWTKLGEADGYNPTQAIREFRKTNGGGWIKMFAYEVHND